MKIKLDAFYQNVKGVKLAPGIHDLDKALATYLVETGHAEYVDEPLSDGSAYTDEALLAVSTGQLANDGDEVMTDIDPDDRDAIKAALDDAGIEYSKYANTDSLYDLLLESNG